ncbi:MAG: hypothetical protein A2204_04700 [Elusimicrobia bacterium RIFOXYA1_FULL_47_7]|nr:MAG: hypothetical protein A2204_04700 [Elusimicrobia bacterium RIFOXYA1_FULL_47_7]
MNSLKALALWQNSEYTSMKPGLSRIRAFLKEAGAPQDSFRSIHIAGSNGKGSTAAMTARMLEASGYKAALYTSPHLLRINERIKINGKEISDGDLAGLSGKYLSLSKKYSLTFFEFITALAFIYFAGRKVDFAVLETGLGGRFDATNTVKRVVVSVITAIGLEHTAVLGDSIEKIAFEKAGIIKSCVPVICGCSDSASLGVIEKAAGQNKSRLYIAGRDFKAGNIHTNWRHGTQFFKYSGLGRVFKAELSLLGPHQIKNALMAITALQLIRNASFEIDFEPSLQALKDIAWPGRFQILKKASASNVTVLDGAHNPQAAEIFAKAWKKSPWAESKAAMIFGILGDKNYKSVIKIFSKTADKVIIVPVKSARNLDHSISAAEWGRYLDKSNISLAPSFSKAAGKVPRGYSTLVSGSLFLVGEALNYFKRK